MNEQMMGEQSEKKATEFIFLIGAEVTKGRILLLKAMLMQFYHQGAVDSADMALSLIDRTIDKAKEKV